MFAARTSNFAAVSALALGLGLTLSACGGGGGGGGQTPPANQAPVANAGPDQAIGGCSVVSLAGSGTDSDGTVTGFTWTQTAGPVVALSSTTAAAPTFSAPTVQAGTDFTFSLVVRDNSNASSTADTVTIRVNPVSGTTVTVNGTVTFARVPFNNLPATGLNYAGTFQAAARSIRIEARGDAQCVFASGTTGPGGNYSLVVPQNQQIAIRAIAHMLRQAPATPPLYDIAVRNGNADTTNPLPEPYSFTGQTFNSSTPNSNANVQIPSGWDNNTRQPTGAGSRQSAPFAILDTIRRAVDFLSDPLNTTPVVTTFPVLNVDWSELKPAGETFYSSGGGNPPSANNRFISLSGEPNVDIDEFDQHTIAHEFGHYIEDQFSRSDSVGGPHGPGDRLDPRVAFGEGWGYAFAGMVLNDPLVRDAVGALQNSEGRFSVETDDPDFEGWYSEASNQEFLWDVFDPAGEGINDAVALGFRPIWTVLTGEQRTTPALTTIFSFGTALKAIPTLTPAEVTAINNLLAGESTSTNSNAFAANETNNAGRADILPLYPLITLGSGPVNVISTDDFGDDGNKLGARRYFRFAPGSSGNATLNVTGGAAGADIDVLVFRNGAVIGDGTTPGNNETVQFAFTGGQVYVFEVYDCANAGCNNTTPPGETTITVTLN